MATYKYYDGTKWNRITGGLVPKTAKTTSDTETYSCNYVNELNQKNIIYLYLRTFTNTTTEESISNPIPFTSSSIKIGDKLSFSDNGVKIGKDVSTIKVSINSTIAKSTEGTYIALILAKNDSAIIRTENRNTTNYSNTFSLNEILLNVTENDIITAQVLNRVAGTSLAQYNSMTVEVIE